MPDYRLKSAYLADGWRRDVVLSVAADGTIAAIRDAAQLPDAGRGAQAVDGIVIPGMPNAHSHAFQRAMAGDTEYRRSAHDSFWTWRQAMYALANRMQPEELELIATQLYVEMLKSGYTSVAEFNYLHRRSADAAGEHLPYEGGNPLWQALCGAADAAGIGLTLLPTLYQTSDFGAQPLKSEQRRFAFETEGFLAAVAQQRAGDRGTRRTGAAFHSLRAVPLEQLRKAALALHALDASLPLHIHIAEQTLEVEACRKQTGKRPIELLLDTGLLNEHWCLVHATHATPAELEALAATRAVVCLSISTEANLGDGLFDAQHFFAAGGRACIGSDSHATVDPTEELRWLEYQQRLRQRKRGVLAGAHESHVGTLLWRSAAEHGAAALGQPVGSLAVGMRADFVVLDPEHPAMAGGALDTSLDRLLFAGGRAAIRDCMVAGRWVVRDGRHAADDMLRARFGALVAKLAG